MCSKHDVTKTLNNWLKWDRARFKFENIFCRLLNFCASRHSQLLILPEKHKKRLSHYIVDFFRYIWENLDGTEEMTDLPLFTIWALSTFNRKLTIVWGVSSLNLKSVTNFTKSVLHDENNKLRGKWKFEILFYSQFYDTACHIFTILAINQSAERILLEIWKLRPPHHAINSLQGSPNAIQCHWKELWRLEVKYVRESEHYIAYEGTCVTGGNWESSEPVSVSPLAWHFKLSHHRFPRLREGKRVSSSPPHIVYGFAEVARAL